MPAPDPALVILGKNIRCLREGLQLTQEALGDLADVHTTYVSDVERGTRNPSALIIIRFAKALKVDVGQLFKGVKA